MRTTRPKIKLEDTVPIKDEFEDTSPMGTPTAISIHNTHSASNVFCCAVLGNMTNGNFYTNMAGTFPVTSLENMQAYFVAYDYDTTTIFAKPCPDFKDATIIAVLKKHLTN